MLKLGKCRAGWIDVALAMAMFQFAPRPARAENPATAQAVGQIVARALHLGANDLDGRLEILRSPLPAGARVHLVSIQKTAGTRGLLARLACDDSSQCVPFYTLVRGANSQFIAPSSPVKPGSRLPMAKSPLRAGDRVEILEELSGLRLRTGGVCLQPGSIGDRIRVRTLSTHRVLVATVATPNLVKVEQ